MHLLQGAGPARSVARPAFPLRAARARTVLLALALAHGGLLACRRGDGTRVTPGASAGHAAAAAAMPVGAGGRAGASPPARPVEAADPHPPPRGTHISLLYAANLRGEYEPCG